MTKFEKYIFKMLGSTRIFSKYVENLNDNYLQVFMLKLS